MARSEKGTPGWQKPCGEFPERTSARTARHGSSGGWKRGYQYIPPKDREKATVNMQVALPYFPTSGPPRIANGNSASNPGYCLVYDHEKGQPPRTGQCFAAGTRVLTPGGMRAIETLRKGDLVLSGGDAQGLPAIDAIVSVYQSTASQTLRLLAGGESIVTTPGHPFAQPDTRWTKAGDLKVGDLILTSGGTVAIDAIESGPAQDVWNLELAESHRYLVANLV